jgi:hypothetical protein
MVSGALDASSVAASSSINEDHDERGSRLLTNTNGAHSLSVKHKDTYQYLQIDVGIVTNITAVATQGRNAIAQWVKDYLLLYSTDGSTWFTYKENDAVKEILIANLWCLTSCLFQLLLVMFDSKHKHGKSISVLELKYMVVHLNVICHWG